MKKLPVASHLNDGEYHLFLKAYAHHNSSMGLKERTKYSISNVVKVERNLKDKCLNIYYVDGNWWHYTVEGTWY